MARKFVTPVRPAQNPRRPQRDLRLFQLHRHPRRRCGRYQPADSEELFAIERIPLARHSLLRTYRIEGGLVTFGLQKALQTPGSPEILGDPEETGGPPVTTGQEHSFWMAAGFCHANSQSHWQFFLRYQAQAERFYRRAIEDFERLRRRGGRALEQPIIETAPKPEPKRPPTPQPHTPKRQLGVPAPTQPAAVRPRRPRRVSHRRRPTRPPVSFTGPRYFQTPPKPSKWDPGVSLQTVVWTPTA